MAELRLEPGSLPQEVTSRLIHIPPVRETDVTGKCDGLSAPVSPDLHVEAKGGR
jgi:hypothetical protein